ncbi:hypothetical protein RB195_008880 [Necator americanus]|uniref:Uncharacterized protein n=1 Tax=Necator americanus TaxID=51031 RepID=A0ABR1CQR3_NECAM
MHEDMKDTIDGRDIKTSLYHLVTRRLGPYVHKFHQCKEVVDDCPYSTDQHITVTTGSRAETTRLLPSIVNLHCAVTVKLSPRCGEIVCI